MFLGRKRKPATKGKSRLASSGPSTIIAVRDEFEQVSGYAEEMNQIKQSLVQWMDTVKQLTSTYASFDDAQLSDLSSKVMDRSSDNGSIGWIFRSLLAYIDEKINFLSVVAQEHAALEQRRQELDRLSKAWTTCKSADKRRVKQEWKALNEAVLQGRKKLQRKLRFVIAEANDSGANGLLMAEMNMFKQLQLIFFNSLSSACSEAGIVATSEIQSEIARFHNALSSYDSADDSEEIEPIHTMSHSGSSFSCAQSECSFDSSVSTQSDKRSSASSTTTSMPSPSTNAGLQVFRNAKVTMLTAWEQMADDEQDRLVAVMTSALLDKGKSTGERLAACGLALIEVEGLVGELCAMASRQPAALKMIHHLHGAMRQFLVPELSVPESLSGRNVVHVADFMLDYTAFVKRVSATVMGLSDEDHFQSLLDDDAKAAVFQTFLDRCNDRLNPDDEGNLSGAELVSAVECVQDWTGKTKVMQMRIIAIHASMSAVQAGLRHVESTAATVYDRLNYTAAVVPMLHSLDATATECDELNVRKWTMPGLEPFDLARLVERFEALRKETKEALLSRDLAGVVTNGGSEGGRVENVIDSHEAVQRVHLLIRNANENLHAPVAKAYVQRSAQHACQTLVRGLFTTVTPILQRNAGSMSTICSFFDAIAADEHALSALNRLDKTAIDEAEIRFKAIKAAYGTGLLKGRVVEAARTENDDELDDDVQIKEMNVGDRVFQLFQSPVEFIPVIVSNWCKDEPRAWRSFLMMAVGVILARDDASAPKAAKMFTRLGGLVHKQDLEGLMAKRAKAQAKPKPGCVATQLERIWPFMATSEMKPTFEPKASPALARQASSARIGRTASSASSTGSRRRESGVGLRLRGGDGNEDDELLKKMKQLVEANQALEEQLKCEEQRSEQLESVVENFQELFKEDLQALGEGETS